MIAGPAEVLLQAMIDKGILVESIDQGPEGWVGVVGPLPPDGDRCIGMVDSGASIQGRIQRGGETIEHPKVQLLLRAENYAVALDKGKSIEKTFLDKIGVPTTMTGGLGWLTVVVNGIAYTIIAAPPFSQLAYLGQDKDKRWSLFSINRHVELG